MRKEATIKLVCLVCAFQHQPAILCHGEGFCFFLHLRDSGREERASLCSETSCCYSFLIHMDSS